MHASKHGLQRNARGTAIAAIGGYFTNSTLAHWQLFEREAFLVLRLQPEFMLLTTGGGGPCHVEVCFGHFWFGLGGGG
jgi:hypothetical protein